MFRKIGSIFENYIEKVVLIIAGILCVWLFVQNILLSPNDIEYRNGRTTEKVSPGEIDNLIKKDADQLSQKIAGSTFITGEPYVPKASDFLARMSSPLKDIKPGLVFQNPADFQGKDPNQSVYDEPDVGVVTNVVVEYIRGAAYVPDAPVTADKGYGYTQSVRQIKDIDLVTVEARYDIAALCENLSYNYVDSVAEQLKDPNLARPVFASVNLRRRQLNDDGTWGNWQNVPRSKVDRNRQASQIIDNAADLTPAAQKVQMIQLDEKQLQIELLQPIAYQFASAREQWYPPLFHQQYLFALKKEIAQERSSTGSTSSTGRRSLTGTGQYNTTDSTTRTRGTLSGRTRGETYIPGTSTTTSTGRPKRGSTTTETLIDTGIESETVKPTELVADDYDSILLTLSSNFAKLKEPVEIWSVDDTVEGGKTYQYRLRVGIFNPVFTGSGDKAVFWSEFSSPTQPVEIPRMLYFFAINVQEAAKTATIDVFKYKNGYWRLKEFSRVGVGELIGKLVEYEEKPATSVSGSSHTTTTTTTTNTLDPAINPESIDFSTGAVLVDIITVDDWSDQPGLNNRKYYSILYSNKGATTNERVPVGATNWPEDMRKIYNSLQKQMAETREKEPFKPWDATERFAGQ